MDSKQGRNQVANKTILSNVIDIPSLSSCRHDSLSTHKWSTRYIASTRIIVSCLYSREFVAISREIC